MWRWGKYRKGLQTPAASEAGTRGAARSACSRAGKTRSSLSSRVPRTDSCLTSGCREHTTRQPQVASRAAIPLGIFNSRVSTQLPPFKKPRRACTPLARTKRAPDLPRVHGKSGQGHDRRVCGWRCGGGQTDRLMLRHCHRSPGGEDGQQTEGGRQDAGTGGPRGRGSSRGVTLARAGRGGSSGASEARGSSCRRWARGPRGAGRRPRGRGRQNGGALGAR